MIETTTPLLMKLRAIANLLGLLLVLVMNYLANALPLNGRTTGELSALYPNLFVPAGLTFAIWGLIYLLLIGFVGFQLYAAFRKPALSRFYPAVFSWQFFATCLLNSGWVLAWHYEKVSLSVILMAALLGSLINMYQRLWLPARPDTWQEKVFVRLPIQVYLGWISVAMIANVTASLVEADWGGWGLPEQTWAAIMLAISAGLGVQQLLKFQDYAYSLVLVWAYLGVILKRNADNSLPDTEVLIAACVGGIVLLLLMALLLIRHNTRLRLA